MLKYRFPGQELIQLEGDFVQIEELGDQSFIVSSFDQTLNYMWSKTAICKPKQSEIPFCIEQPAYLSQAEQIIADLGRGIADKIVYSRIKKSNAKIKDPQRLFEQLLDKYPNALVYYFENTILGSWIGASPEILIERYQEGFRTMSLAGTKLSAENRDFSFKEYNEHEMVSEFIEGQLRQIPNANIKISEVQHYNTGPVTHLLQEFTWQMPNYVLPLLIKHLHPTPAVAGLPKKVAQNYILAIESHQRELYSGIIGTSILGRERLFVNLRCAQIIDGYLYCYVGGGFTPDSKAQDEWLETENKSQTLLDLL